jgi:hypothetical protein
VSGELKVDTKPTSLFGSEVELVPVGDGRFHVASPEVGKFKGQVYTEPGMIFAFELSGGHARSVQLLGYDNTVIAKGELQK